MGVAVEPTNGKNNISFEFKQKGRKIGDDGKQMHCLLDISSSRHRISALKIK